MTTKPLNVGDDANRSLMIRASAGTGKTFQLSNRYLTRLVDGILPDQILATTFTRNAAAEIFERVLKRLAMAATSDANATELGSEIGRPELTREDSVRLLAQFTKSLHRVRVSTLDSFFVKLAGNFSQELGLPADWSIIDESDQGNLQLRAIERMLQRDSKSLQRILNLMQKGQTKRNISFQVQDAVKNLYQHYRISERSAWESFPDLPKLKSEEIDACIEKMHNLRPKKSSQEKQRLRLIQAANIGDWVGFTKGKFCENIENGTMTFSKAAIDPDLAEAVLPLIGHARAMQVKQWAEQNARTWELLDRFHKELTALKHNEKVFQFDDMNHFLQPTHLDQIGQRIQYRMDGRVTNLLLDEFQDTSLSQWNAIRPFAKNSAKPDDEKRSFFCVGDVKQAIYGWRGGDAAIFDTIERTLPVKTASLERSYRSSKVVIESVNRLFNRLEHHPAMGNQEQGVSNWLEGFDDHSTARDDLEGYCRVMVGPAVEEDKLAAAATFSFAAEQIAETRRRCPGRSVGVLCRTKKTVRQMVFELRRLGVAASEEGANPLDDSAAVQAMLSLFTLADHPADKIAAFHVENSPLIDCSLLSAFKGNFNRRSVSRYLRQQLIAAGYGKIVLDVADDLQDKLNDRERRRILQLAEIAGEYDQRNSLRPIEFVDYVNNKPVSESSGDQVRVMTVHQSKGLEFDVVVLPELDGALYKTDLKCVWSANEEGVRERVYIYRGADMQGGLDAATRKAIDDTHARQTGEAMSLLYVAVTRAVHELQIYVPASSCQKIPAGKASGYIRAAMYGTGPIEAEQILYEHGDVFWSDSTPLKTVPSPSTLEHTLPPTVKLKPQTVRSRGLDRQAPSSKGHRRTKLSSRLSSRSEKAMNYGTVVHKWFEQIEWLDDGLPTDDQLRNAIDDPALSDLDIDKVLFDFHTSMKSAQLRKLMSKELYASSKFDTVEVQRERRFTVRIDQAVVNGTIDRLVVCRKNGKPVIADIIDFKTDTASTKDEIKAKAADYKPQLENYRAAVSKLFGLDPKQISARLVFTQAGKVAQV